MPTSEEWREVVDELVDAAARLRSPALARLYRLAVEEARRVLHRFPGEVRAQVDDIVHDLIYAKVDAIVTAPNPRGLFITAVRNAAIDVQRREKRLVRNDVVMSSQADSARAVDQVASARIDAAIVLQALSPREQEVFAAIAAGEDRDEIARALGTSRANIDQIVSRARKRLGGAG